MQLNAKHTLTSPITTGVDTISIPYCIDCNSSRSRKELVKPINAEKCTKIRKFLTSIFHFPLGLRNRLLNQFMMHCGTLWTSRYDVLCDEKRFRPLKLMLRGSQIKVGGVHNSKKCPGPPQNDHICTRTTYIHIFAFNAKQKAITCYWTLL